MGWRIPTGAEAASLGVRDEEGAEGSRDDGWRKMWPDEWKV